MRFKLYLREELIVRDDRNKIISKYKLKFTKKNIEKIAYNYDFKINKIEFDAKTAILKDKINRILFVDTM